MSDPFIDRIKENEAILSKLTDEQVILLSLSEIVLETAEGKDVPPGIKARRICLSAELSKRAGIRW